MKGAVPAVLTTLLATGCATGGYVGPKPYPGGLGDVVAGNLALTCPGSVYLGPPINRCADHLLIGGTGYWGYYESGRFIPVYPVYGPGFRLLYAAAIGAAGGYAASGTAGGAVRGAAIGLGAGVASDAVSVYGHAGLFTGLRANTYRVRNPTGYFAEIFDGPQRVALLRPGDEVFIPEPTRVLTARVRIPEGGRLRTVWVELRPTGGTAWEVPLP